MKKHDDRVAHLVGQTLTREWAGARHEVLVLAEGGFEYAGQHYSSLSAVGKIITGRSTNGFEFFGLLGGVRPAKPAKPATRQEMQASNFGVSARSAPATGAPPTAGAIVPRAAGAPRRVDCVNCSCDHQADNPARSGCCCGSACVAYQPEPTVHYALPSGRAACGEVKLRPDNRSWMRAFATCIKCKKKESGDE